MYKSSLSTFCIFESPVSRKHVDLQNRARPRHHKSKRSSNIRLIKTFCNTHFLTRVSFWCKKPMEKRNIPEQFFKQHRQTKAGSGLRGILLVICSECPPSEETKIVAPTNSPNSHSNPKFEEQCNSNCANVRNAKGQVCCPIFLLKDNSELEDNYSRVSCCLGLGSDLECLQNFPNMASSCTLFHSELEDNYPPRVQGIKF